MRSSSRCLSKSRILMFCFSTSVPMSALAEGQSTKIPTTSSPSQTTHNNFGGFEGSPTPEAIFALRFFICVGVSCSAEILPTLRSSLRLEANSMTDRRPIKNPALGPGCLSLLDTRRNDRMGLISLIRSVMSTGNHAARSISRPSPSKMSAACAKASFTRSSAALPISCRHRRRVDSGVPSLSQVFMS